ncbi:hypothetical protein [Streptomyces roseicoloratus]|uniref:hypothetical protein n=1 Tax=Streptomyces roseicoloratus TaxID=2508722 RepID=UPI0010099A8E|nr:hypothetical protein [Streptomyces roseicoloratus]
MSINLTRPTPVTPVLPAPFDSRDALLHAFAVTEKVIAELADRPSSVTIDEYDGAYRVQVYFHRQPAQVQRFAARYCVEVLVDAHYNGDTSTYTWAEVRVDGVSVRGWALLRHEERAA